MLVFASICPHPPIIIPHIGGEEIKKVSRTVVAMNSISTLFADANPETLVLVSPHSPASPEEFLVNTSQIVQPTLQNFGDFIERFPKYNSDTELANKIVQNANKKKLPCKSYFQEILDHGVVVPLYYMMQRKPNFNIVNLSFSMLDKDIHLKYGKLIGEIIKNSKKRIAFIASGDMSHCLTADAPSGFNQNAHLFDEKIVDAIKQNNLESISKIDGRMIEQAGECGYRSFLILSGILSNYTNIESELLSYEAPFGVGYLVANFKFK